MEWDVEVASEREEDGMREASRNADGWSWKKAGVEFSSWTWYLEVPGAPGSAKPQVTEVRCTTGNPQGNPQGNPTASSHCWAGAGLVLQRLAERCNGTRTFRGTAGTRAH